MKKLFSPILLWIVLSILPAMGAVAQDDIIELDFVHIFSDDLRPAVIQEVIDEYEALHPNVKINSYSTNSDSDYEEIFISALDNADLGQAPNIVQVEEGFTQQAIDYGYFVPISDIATDEQMTSLDDIFPTIRAFYQLDDKVWGMPWNVSNPVLYYSKDAFTAAGLDPEQSPQTFEDMVAYCDAIMSADLGYSACVNWPLSTWFVEQWVAMQGELFLNNENGRGGRATEPNFTSDAVMNIMRWWEQLDGAGYFSYSGRLNDSNGEGVAFLSGRTAMHINSTAGLSLFQNYARFELGVGPLPLPNAEATNGMSVGGGSLWVMSDQTEEEMQASVDFIFFLTNTENGIKWHQGTGYMPLRISSYNQLVDEGYYVENPFYEVAVLQFANSIVSPATSGAVAGPTSEVRGELLAAFQSLLNGETDSDEAILNALQGAQERATAELQDYNQDFE